MVIGHLIESLSLGIVTALTVPCVLPLYPGFIAYLSNRVKSGSKLAVFKLSLFVTLGLIVFMALLGLIFTTLLETSLSKIIGIVSPIAFILLAVIGILLMFNFDFAKIFPQFQSPEAKNPYLEAFLFGFFFGLIIIPCNPGLIALAFTRALGIESTALNLSGFLFFSIGIGFPLMALSLMSGAASKTIINFFTKNKRMINLIMGLLLLGISIYYLLGTFNVLGG